MRWHTKPHPFAVEPLSTSKTPGTSKVPSTSLLHERCACESRYRAGQTEGDVLPSTQIKKGDVPEGRGRSCARTGQGRSCARTGQGRSCARTGQGPYVRWRTQRSANLPYAISLTGQAFGGHKVVPALHKCRVNPTEEPESEFATSARPATKSPARCTAAG